MSNHHLLRAVKPPPFPLPKKQLLSLRRTKKNEEERRTDFGQSNFALSNVRALRATIIAGLVSLKIVTANSVEGVEGQKSDIA